MSQSDELANSDLGVERISRSAVSEAEWMARVELAALYRLISLDGWDDAVATHISLRVPDEPRSFLVNPYGSFFEETDASSLVKVDLDGKILSPGGARINDAAFVIHSAVHAERDDAHCVMHVHTDATIAVSCRSEGLLPLTQNALIVLPFLAYHAYEGLAFNPEERSRLVKNLDSALLMLLRNHGALSLGRNPGGAWLGMKTLENACRQQLLADRDDRTKLLLPSEDIQAHVAAQMTDEMILRSAEVIWPGLLRRAHRLAPGFDC